MHVKKCIFFFYLSMFVGLAHAADIPNGKSGWNIGFIPFAAYNSDLGLQLGGLANVYYYGDGKQYPAYQHSWYAEISHFSKGSGLYRFFYDTEYLLPGYKLSIDALYMPDQALDFFGFNGYDAVFQPDWIDEYAASYQSRMFYKHERNLLRFKIDMQHSTPIPHTRWVVGYAFKQFTVNEVNINQLNKGKEPHEQLPAIDGLYAKYIDWGIISATEAKGGIHHDITTGLVYDTRNNEPCPTQGIWSEIVLLNSFHPEFTYGKLALTHRQYFPITSQLSSAIRIGYQQHIYGKSPFYLYPYMVYSYLPSPEIDGIGGSKTVRGILRNRIVGNGVAFGNAELRYKFWHFQLFKQQWYAALNPFVDAGMVVDKIPLQITHITEDITPYFASNAEKIHLSYGCGIRAAMNENFVLATDIGFPLSKQDGTMGLYIGINWLF